MRFLPVVPFAFATLLGPPRLGAQQSSPPFDVHVSCTEAKQLLAARAEGHAVVSPILAIERRDQADDALRALTNLAIDRPGCPAAFGLRALVKWSIAGTGWIPKDAPGQRPGVSWNEDAVYDLAEAARHPGPQAGPAAVVGVHFLLPDQVELPWLVREVGPGMLPSLAVASSVTDSTQQLARGRLAAWLWEPLVAESAFARYAAAGGSSARADLERARVGLAVGTPGAAERYYRAALSRDSAVIAGLREDISLIADSAELAEFDTTMTGSREAWLRSFWEDRDLVSLRPRGSRLTEHYRRVGVARQNFRLLVYPRRYELNELWVNPSAEYDDRGLIFVRHGAPDDTASAVRPGACPNVSWKYRRADGHLIFHFVARENPNDWRLVETLANVGGDRGATTRVRRAGNAYTCAPIDGLMESRSELDPIYARLAVSANRRNWERELELTTHSREVGTTTDSNVLRFGNVLEAAWRAYGLFGDDGERGRVLLVTSVGTDDLRSVDPSHFVYAFRTHAVLTRGDRTIEADSLRRFGLRAEPPAGLMLSFTDEVSVPPGTWSVGMVIRQAADTSGQFFRDGDVSVPSAASSLAVSDVVLGAQRGGLAWRAPDGEFPLTSTGSYRRGETVPVYYEFTAPGEGEAITTSVAFRREGDRNATEIQFNERAHAGINRSRRELDTSRLKPGRYDLTLRLSTAAGREAVRQTSLFVRDR